ncbi:MAG: hexameric tyrosine-coordinated heme protein [Myxococcota bacterium]
MTAYTEEGLQKLITETPAEGRALAMLLARKTIAAIQPDPEVRSRLRPVYAEDPRALIDAGRVVALEFQTIAAANNYWRG